MKTYILIFIAVLCITTIFGGVSGARKYQAVGVSDVVIDETEANPAQKQEGMIGEMILVDTDKPHKGYGPVRDTAKGGGADFPRLGRF